LRKSALKPNQTLLAFYEGVPQTARAAATTGMVLPDKSRFFSRRIEAICRSDEEILAEVEKVVRHEIAHHLRHQRCPDEGNRQILIFICPLLTKPK